MSDIGPLLRHEVVVFEDEEYDGYETGGFTDGNIETMEDATNLPDEAKAALAASVIVSMESIANKEPQAFLKMMLEDYKKRRKTAMVDGQ